MPPETPKPKAKLTTEDIQRYEKLYQRNWRSLYRWVEIGEKSNDPCPLHDPRAMLDWWARVKPRRSPPLELEQAAANALIAVARPPAASPDPASPPPPSLDRETPPTMPEGNGARDVTGLNPIINLEDFDPEEGDSIREMRKLKAAKFHQLKTALAEGRDTSAIESSYVRTSEILDKMETRAAERMKKRGLLILREDVDKDLATVAELLRQMRESMTRRVLELCTSLTRDQAIEVSSAITTARGHEDRILSRLDCLKTDDLLRELAA